MSGFDNRQKAFEEQYRLDQEKLFRVTVRRNRLIGKWAAEQLGLAADKVDSYILSVVESDFSEPGDADVIGKIMADFQAKGLSHTESNIKSKLVEFFEQAVQQIQ